ncbi:MAG: DUF3231 family protein [Bacillus sp. (in: Bacteria)]|nr:DUF3231 family protein [Bacillus sp. (in: firmicutes)]
MISSELGDLFANYLGDSLFKCVFEHHLQVVEDNDIKEFLEFGLETGQKHLQMIRDIYEKENIPLPVGFGEEDVRKDAPRLFSDIFMVFYMTEMARAGLHTYASALSTSYRQDIINYFTMCLDDSTIIYNKGVHLLLSKGMDTAPPIIPYPKKVDFVEKDSFISVLAGKSRPVTALEIKHLQININTNTLGKAIMLAFSQIASSEELKAYFKRGANLANEQIVELGKLLLNDNLPTPKILDVHITDTTASPFSDKLLLYHAVLSTGIGIQNYGTAISKIMRHDIHLQFTTLSTSIGKFGNDGMELMIKKGWLEEPPTAADRDKLSRNS